MRGRSDFLGSNLTCGGLPLSIVINSEVILFITNSVASSSAAGSSSFPYQFDKSNGSPAVTKTLVPGKNFIFLLYIVAFILAEEIKILLIESRELFIYI